jgi:hypothetical protein
LIDHDWYSILDILLHLQRLKDRHDHKIAKDMCHQVFPNAAVGSWGIVRPRVDPIGGKLVWRYVWVWEGAIRGSRLWTEPDRFRSDLVALTGFELCPYKVKLHGRTKVLDIKWAPEGTIQKVSIVSMTDEQLLAGRIKAEELLSGLEGSAHSPIQRVGKKMRWAVRCFRKEIERRGL